MPRLIPTSSMPFGSSSIVPVANVGSPFGGGSPATPKFGERNDYEPSFSSSSSAPSSSVRLSCSSPGGRSVHSLSVTSSGTCYIETHSLPLAGTVETNDDNEYLGSSSNNKKTSVIRTRLPHKISSALSRYPPIELLCVDALSSPNASAAIIGSPSGTRNRNGGALVQVPWLCIYTKKDVFLLKISYENIGVMEVEGVVSAVLEPFEDVLIGDTATNILRVRQAPQKFNGYATLCPVGAMAMLTQNPSTGEYCLCVHHGIERKSSLTTPTSSSAPTTHHFRMEELADPNERMVDFCFCKSIGLPLLSSLTVAFLKVSGEVLFATPIVFRDTVVPSQIVAQTSDFLSNSLEESRPDTAPWRQFRAAKRFLDDAFPYNGSANFVTVGQTSTVGSRSKSLSEVFNWPVQLQGPIVLPPQLEDSAYGGSAGSIEPLASEGDLVGLSIGHKEEMVDFAVVSPSSFIPRFKFEHWNDSYELDQDLTIGRVINRVVLDCSDLDERKNVADIKLIPDPIMDNVIHYMTANQIVCISTNATRIASNQVRESRPNGMDSGMFSPASKRSESKLNATIWKSLDTTFFKGGQNPIVGAVISDDVQLGHILVARLANGEMVAINLTETRHLRDFESFAAPEQTVLAIEDGSVAARSQAEKQALALLDKTRPLAEVVQPLMRDVFKGITGLAQVGGSATAQADITPAVLAGVVGIVSKCKKEIQLPLKTMNEHVSARRAESNAVIAKQNRQLKALKEMIANLRETQNIVREKAEIMLQNSKSLADRSASVMQSSKDLLPTITQAEYDYFQELRRLDEKSKLWKNETERLSRKILSINDSLAHSTSDMVNLSSFDQENAGQLLYTSGMLLKGYEQKLASEKVKLGGLTAYANELAQA
mmetsp:Transcript_9249/g.27559  ORF Transcript_9249/g.27559 Transcript_9249/m.27559 type:complete len:882 (+) Transcript_9249:77-2722(+)|eukprot:CAMPEP_0172373568 /NCGR_PEP_ID=MMETSP1060-20121228/52241_1 /TAXON_ID=37318 /ORGANISM="Pseudo-nitzschia pungens, Strain cf. cingulata" /LENGTH=881 /DNA_ID=CAMNT_0013099945 /DNA_START=60 /DNA_END=2705 /DNA_ORIENTATION=+